MRTLTVDGLLAGEVPMNRPTYLHMDVMLAAMEVEPICSYS